MALTTYTAATDIIKTLGTNPEDRPTLTDDTFKAKFDENAANIKAFLNAMIAELLSTANGKGASQIGIEDSGSKFTATTVEAALAESATTIIANDGKLTTHKAETISHALSVTRDISLTTTQTITLPFKAKSININATISGTAIQSIGMYGENAGQNAIASLTDNSKVPIAAAVALYTSGSVFNFGTIQNVTATGFDISWAKTGSPTGTATLQILAMTH